MLRQAKRLLGLSRPLLQAQQVSYGAELLGACQAGFTSLLCPIDLCRALAAQETPTPVDHFFETGEGLKTLRSLASTVWL